MGATSIEITSMKVESPADRYRSFDSFAESPPDREATEEVLRDARTHFAEAWKAVIEKEDSPQYKMLQDFVDMMTVVPVSPDDPIHYPTRCNRNGQPESDRVHDEIYTWFVAYRRNGNRIPLPEPRVERTDRTKRLPVDPRSTS